MPEGHEQELHAYFDQLVQATEAGVITWKEVNPTSYLWSAGGNAFFTIQRTESIVQRRAANGAVVSAKEPAFIFQAYEMSNLVSSLGSTLKFSVNTTEERNFRDKLAVLFEAIRSKASEEGIDFLKQHLPRKG